MRSDLERRLEMKANGCLVFAWGYNPRAKELFGTRYRHGYGGRALGKTRPFLKNLIAKMRKEVA